MNYKSLLEGMAFGALVAVSITVWEHYRVKPLPPMPPIVHTGPAFSASAEPAQSIEDRLRHYDAHDAWLKRRDLEFDKCDALHGTPVLGFSMKVVCLDSHAVKFVGEPSPPYE